ncbi:SDR family NAD(P)-dependent oxidoreductase [Pseudomonas sp.]|uniref:SDR family NAD(P)-dependent oxidoreductase n=1 Tax=Pseudomonas sp. TaxID=306 RepID=UPI003D6E3E5B
MNNPISKRVWVTGASSGLGLALVEHLLEKGARVAASGRACKTLQDLTLQYHPNLLLLDSNLTEQLEALEAAKQITDRWGALDCLIINAGTCDYLAVDTPAPAIFESIVSSNLSASSYCLESAVPLLQGGRSPQVAGILSRYSSLQLNEASQLTTADNSLMQLFNNQRATLAAQAIDLTIIAPLNLKFPLIPEQIIPEQWTAQSAAEVILNRLPARSANLVLEALHLNNLWPLPK